MARAGPEAAAGKAREGRAGPGCAAAARDGSGECSQRAKGTGDRMGQGTVTGAEPGQGWGPKLQPTAKAAQQKQRLVRARAARTPNLLQLHCSASSCKSWCAKAPTKPHTGLWTLQGGSQLWDQAEAPPAPHEKAQSPSNKAAITLPPHCPLQGTDPSLPPRGRNCTVQPARGSQPGLSTPGEADSPPGPPPCA